MLHLQGYPQNQGLKSKALDPNSQEEIDVYCDHVKPNDFVLCGNNANHLPYLLHNEPTHN